MEEPENNETMNNQFDTQPTFMITDPYKGLRDEPIIINRVPVVRVGKKIGRNDKCECGSENKYKRCCGK